MADAGESRLEYPRCRHPLQELAHTVVVDDGDEIRHQDPAVTPLDAHCKLVAKERTAVSPMPGTRKCSRSAEAISRSNSSSGTMRSTDSVRAIQLAPWIKSSRWKRSGM